MLTTVILVSYHTGPVLQQAIASILAQTGTVEVVVVDNGNPPEILTQLETWAATDARLRILSGHGNVGFSTGCNLGARAARGERLLFLNPDSILPADALESLHRHATSLTSSWMIGARLLNEDGTDQRGCRRALLTPMTALIEALHLHPFFPQARLNRHAEALPMVLTPIPAISGAFMFLSREDFWRIGGFDEGYFLHVEDLDLCLRFHRASGTIYFAPDIRVTHVGGTSRTTTAFIEKHKAHGFIRYFRRHFADESPAILLGLLTIAIWLRAGLKIASHSLAARAKH